MHAIGFWVLQVKREFDFRDRSEQTCWSAEERKVKTIYIGNLPFSASDNDIRELFAQHGTVHSVNLINDRETGRPRGFGFVEMDPEAATAAISSLDGTDYGGRSLRVNEARERGARPPRRSW